MEKDENKINEPIEEKKVYSVFDRFKKKSK